MNPSGDAAEQVVRLSLEGVEVAAKITGNLMDKIISVMYIKLYLDYDLGIDFYPQFVKNADGCNASGNAE